MLNRPDYKRLVKLVQKTIDDQKASSTKLVAITKSFFSPFFHKQHDFDQSWPKAIKELGLVNDGSGTSTFTIPGHGIRDIVLRDPVHGLPLNAQLVQAPAPRPGDLHRTCYRCKHDFVVTAGEQKYLANIFGGNYKPPKYCKPCRQIRKARKAQQPQGE